ncbi:MAG: hypothetical protein MUF72_20720 [Elainella sp. Prado103]|nr:hypothetical protein [Elainella sp. Prado103]
MNTRSQPVPTLLQNQLNLSVKHQPIDRKAEIVDLLSAEQPHKSRIVDLNYTCCTWWEGCYYCQDDKTQQWHRVKCFL